MRPFEIALISIFGVAAIGALFYFSKYKPAEDPTAKLYGESVVVWGTFDRATVDTLFMELTNDNKPFKAVTYRQIDKRSFGSTLVNAIAEGKGPDLVIMPNSELVTYRSKLFAIPFETLSERTFNDSFIDGAGVFLRSDGIYGIPLAVDPLVMYWNRDIFSSSGLSTPPKTWETLISQTIPAVNRFDTSSNFTQNTIALGESSNITNAKNILTLLFFQAGSDIVTESNYGYAVTLDKAVGGSMPAGKAGLSFYAQFAMPTKSAYSWNRARQNDRNEFVGGTLGLYFGMGSERSILEKDNSNLNYDVAVVPQGSGVNIYRTYGDFYAFTIPRSSKNIQGAYAVATFLSEDAQAKKFSTLFGLSPVRRSLLGESQVDSFKNVLHQSALIARGWLDPNPVATREIFETMIDGALASHEGTESALRDALARLHALF